MIVVLFGISMLYLALGLSWRVFPSEIWSERLALCPTLAATLIIAGANLLGPVGCRLPLTILGTVAGTALLAPLIAGKKRLPPPSPCTWWWGKGVLVLLVFIYVCYAQFRFLDTDNWIHEPLIAGYSLGIFPPVHPFFPEVVMNGHYGRDLLCGALTPRGADPLIAVWVLNPLLAVSACLILVRTFEKSESGRLGSLGAAIFAFFGICVGFRVGLADTTDGNNGVAYAFLILLMYLMTEVLEFTQDRPQTMRPGLWILSGFVLGTSQLVYEIHFGLLLLTAASLLPYAVYRCAHKKRLLTGVLMTAVIGLLLALTEGGPFTELVHSKLRQQTTLDVRASEVNLQQTVSLSFPKEKIFHVLATPADYQRISVGFQMAPFKNWIPIFSPAGYLSVFAPEFLVSHWLPLFLAPFSLWLILRRRHLVGLCFWLFGSWAYLVPSLIDFGPVYEWEYFRWEFAAGFGWAAALGLLCGTLLSRTENDESLLYREEGYGLTLRLNRSHLPLLVGCAIAVLGLLPAEKMFNKAIIDLQKHGLPGPLSPAEWRVAQSVLGVTVADIEVADALSKQIEAGQQVMTNLGQETPLGLWPDSVLSALTGARIAGRAKPPNDRLIHAHPNYHRSSTWKVVTGTGRLDPLWPKELSWMVLDPQKDSLSAVLTDSEHTTLEADITDAQGHTRQLWRLHPPASLSSAGSPVEPPLKAEILQPDLRNQKREWRTSTVYELIFHWQKASTWAAGPTWLEVRIESSGDDDQVSYEPLFFLLHNGPQKSPLESIQEVAFVTPLEEGDFDVVGRTPTDGSTVEVFRFPITIDYQSRLRELVASIEVPDRAVTRSNVALQITLDSEEALKSEGELTLLLRFKTENDDYLWEMDRLPHPLNFALMDGGTFSLEWKVMAPWNDGIYELELELLDQHTRLRTPLRLSAPARLLVVSP